MRLLAFVGIIALNAISLRALWLAADVSPWLAVVAAAMLVIFNLDARQRARQYVPTEPKESPHA